MMSSCHASTGSAALAPSCPALHRLCDLHRTCSLLGKAVAELLCQCWHGVLQIRVSGARRLLLPLLLPGTGHRALGRAALPVVCIPRVHPLCASSVSPARQCKMGMLHRVPVMVLLLLVHLARRRPEGVRCCVRMPKSRTIAGGTQCYSSDHWLNTGHKGCHSCLSSSSHVRELCNEPLRRGLVGQRPCCTVLTHTTLWAQQPHLQASAGVPCPRCHDPCKTLAWSKHGTICAQHA